MGKENNLDSLSIKFFETLQLHKMLREAKNGQLDAEALAKYAGFKSYAECGLEDSIKIRLILGDKKTISLNELEIRTEIALQACDKSPHKDGRLDTKEIDSFDPLALPPLKKTAERKK